MESGNALLIVLMTAASKSTFIIFGDQKEHQLFSKDDNILFLFYPVEVLTLYMCMYFSCDMLLRSSFKLYNWANCLG